jgi:fibronectin-binding autotransporter adhesin
MKPTHALWGFLAVSHSTIIHAATLTWDANAATAPTAIDGGGTWTTANTFFDGTNNVTWPTGGAVADIASFGNASTTPVGIPGAIAFTTAVSAGGLQFNPYYGNAVKYNIQGGTGGILTLNGTPTIAVETRSDRPFAAINAILAGTAGFDVTTTTGGILEIGTQANTITGGIRLKNNSALSVAADASYGGGGAPLTFDGNAALITRTGHSPTATRTISVTTGNTAKFDSLTGQTLTLLGPVSGAGNIQKEGLGGLTLNTGSTYGGSTGIRQGTLTLNFANAAAPVAPNTDIIPAASNLRLLGGTLSVTGKASTPNTQTFASTTLLPGISAVNSTAGATGGTTAVNFGAITRNPGSIFNVATIAAGTSYTTTTPNVNGILGGYAALNFADWVTATGGTLAAYAAYQTGTDATLWAATDNVSIAATPTTVLAGSATLNSVKLTGSATLAVPAGQTLTVTSGGMLVTGGPASVSGGNLQGSASGDLVVHQHAAASAATISSNIIDNGGATGLTKGGAGNLILSGTNLYSGNTYLNAGTLEVTSDSNLGTGSTVTMRQNTTLRLAGSSAFSSSKSFLFDFGSDSFGGAALGGGATDVGNFNLDVTNTAGATLSGNFNIPAGNVTKSGAGTLTLTNTGVHQLGRLNGGLGFFVYDGGLVFNGGASSEWRAGQLEFVIGVGNEATKGSSKQAVVTVQSGKVTVGSWTGISRGNGTSNLSSKLLMTGGTWDTGNVSLGFANGVVGFLAKPVLDLSNDAQMFVRDEARISESTGADSTINLSGTSLLTTRNQLRASFQTGTNTTINLSGSSTLNIGSFVSMGLPGSCTVNMADSSTYTVGSDFNVADTDNSTATLNITGGTANANTLYVGKGSNAATVSTTRAAVNQSGGLLQNLSNAGGDWRIGGGVGANDSECYGSYVLSNGTFNSGGRNLQIGAFGIGVMDVRGGTAITNTIGGFPVVGRFAGSFGELEVSSGSFTVSSAGQLLILGEAGNGVLNVSGTGSVVVNSGAGGAGNAGGTGGIRIGHAAGATGTINLNGGTVETSGIAKSVNSVTTFGYAYLNGGLLKAKAPNTTFMQGLDNAYVGPLGAKIDTAGSAITIGQSLLGSATTAGVTTIPVLTGGAGYMGAPVVRISGGAGVGATAIANVTGGVVTSITITNPGSGFLGAPSVQLLGGGATTAATLGAATFGTGAADGGLTKSGIGALTLGGTNTYTGTTAVTADTLLVNGSVAGPVTVAANCTIGGSGTLGSTLVVDASSFMEPGTLTTAGTLTTNGNVTMPGTLHIQLDGATADRLTVNGNLDLTGSTLEVQSLAGGATQSSYTIVSYTGTLTGSLTLSGSLPATYTLFNDVANKAIKLVSSGNYGSWQAGFGLLLGTTGAPGADADSDQLPNAVEYVLGGDPTLPSTTLAPTQTLTPTSIIFTFNRVDASETPDTTLAVEASTDLAGFPLSFTIGSTTANSSPGVTITENGAAPDTVTVVIPRGTNPSMFVRLNVNIAP